MSRKLPQLTPVRVERALLKAGFVLRRIKGSHHHYKHPDRPEFLVTVPFHTGTVPSGLLGKIVKDAALTRSQFRDFL